MQLSIHYYVLSKSNRKRRLNGGFRDTLIHIQNTGFPFEAPSRHDETFKLLSKLERLEEFLRERDQHFTHFFAQDPLWMVLVGERKMLSVFKSTTSHHDTALGERDHTAVSTSDLGKIVWSVVKQALGGSNDRDLDELQAAAETRTIAIGFDAVSRAVQSASVSSLFVEEDYHITGSVREMQDALVLLPHVDVSDVIDDAVDHIVGKVLGQGGNAVFLESNTMRKFQKIALIVRDGASSGRGVLNGYSLVR